MIRTIAAILTAAALTGVTVHQLDGSSARGELQREHTAASYCLRHSDWDGTLRDFADCVTRAQDILSRSSH